MAKKENNSKTNYGKKDKKAFNKKAEKNVKSNKNNKAVAKTKRTNKKEQSLSEGTALIGVEKRNLSVIKETVKAVTKVPNREMVKVPSKDMIVKNEQKSIDLLCVRS